MAGAEVDELETGYMVYLIDARYPRSRSVIFGTDRPQGVKGATILLLSTDPRGPAYS